MRQVGMKPGGSERRIYAAGRNNGCMRQTVDRRVRTPSGPTPRAGLRWVAKLLETGPRAQPKVLPCRVNAAFRNQVDRNAAFMRQVGMKPGGSERCIYAAAAPA